MSNLIFDIDERNKYDEGRVIAALERFNDDNCIVGSYIFPVMTKEIFLECYKRWILGGAGGRIMNKEEAILLLNSVKLMSCNEKGEPISDLYFALEIAIEALGQIDKIKQIIAIDNSVIQEDVMKYKMICEVLKE